MSITYEKDKEGFLTVTVAPSFDGHISIKNGQVTIVSSGGGGVSSAAIACGPSGGGGASGSNGRDGRGIEAGSCGGGGPKWNPYQYKGEMK